MSTENETGEATEAEVAEAIEGAEKAEAEQTESAVEKKPEPEAKPADKPAHTVPYGELKSERERRQEAERTAKQYEQRFADIVQRFVRPPEQQQPQLPSRDDRPVEHFDARINGVENEMGELRKFRAEQAHRSEQEQAVAGITNSYRASAAEFAQQQPDFTDAYNFLGEQRIGELMDIGWDRANAERIAANNELAIAAKAIQDGANPAERIYAIAKRRGYVAKAAQAQQKLDTIAKGQQAQGIGGAGGQAPAGRPTLENIAKMSDDEWSKMTPERFERMMKQAGHA